MRQFFVTPCATLLTATLLTAALLAAALALPCGARAASSATASASNAALRVRIDALCTAWLARTGAPSVSIAIVQHGQITYARAYGFARRHPEIPATTATRYPIDSVSKEFTAAAVLLLRDAGKLSLSAPVATYWPGLGAAGDADLRQVLSHTAGIRDYWPQDFVPDYMKRPTTTAAILARFAAPGLDFAPGSSWQYSNTGYTLAGAIVEKFSSQPLVDFLNARIFTPLGMTRVTEDDTAPLSAPDAQGFTRYGFGPLHPAPKEAAGWLAGAAELAMTPTDLARWDIGLMSGRALPPGDIADLERPVPAADGSSPRYGLGLMHETIAGRHAVGHDGAGSGYFANNVFFPAHDAAVVVLTNNDFAFPEALTASLAAAILPPPANRARAEKVFADLAAGHIDPALFTRDGADYFTPAVLADLRASLSALGPARHVTLTGNTRRGGFATTYWQVTCAKRTVQVVERATPNGRIEQFLVMMAGS